MFAALVVASCKHDLLPDSLMVQDRPLEVSIETPEYDGGNTKASTDLLSEAYYKISNVCFFEYQEGKLIKHGFCNGKSLSGLTLPGNGQPVDIYLMANVGDIMQDTEIAAALQNEDGIRNYVYSVDSYNTFETEGFPCAGEYHNVTRSNIPNMSVKHLGGIYRFRYQKSADSDKKIISLTMRQMTSNVKPFGSLTANEVVPVKYTQSLSDVQITKLQNGEYVDLYFFENLQGSTNNMEASQKGLELQNTLADKRATIIEVQTNHEFRKIYLGQNNMNDYNILRSHMTNLTFADINVDEPSRYYFTFMDGYYEDHDTGVECYGLDFISCSYLEVNYKNTVSNIAIYSVDIRTNIPDPYDIEFRNTRSGQIDCSDINMWIEDYDYLGEDKYAIHIYSDGLMDREEILQLYYKGEPLSAGVLLNPYSDIHPITLISPTLTVDFTINKTGIESMAKLAKRVSDEHGITDGFDISGKFLFSYYDSTIGKRQNIYVPFTFYIDKNGNYDPCIIKDYQLMDHSIPKSDYETANWVLCSGLRLGEKISMLGEYQTYMQNISEQFNCFYINFWGFLQNIGFTKEEWSSFVPFYPFGALEREDEISLKSSMTKWKTPSNSHIEIYLRKK